MQQAVRDVTENLSAGGLFIRTDAICAREIASRSRSASPGCSSRSRSRSRWCGVRPPVRTTPRRRGEDPVDHADDRQKLARIAETARAGHEPAVKRTYRVLVVEDNAHVVEMYEFALRRLRPRGRTAWTSRSSTRRTASRRSPGSRAAAHRPRDGRPVHAGARRVHAHRADAADPALARTPIVVISARGGRARARAAELGVDVYLQKPVQFADIIDDGPHAAPDPG